MLWKIVDLTTTDIRVALLNRCRGRANALGLRSLLTGQQTQSRYHVCNNRREPASRRRYTKSAQKAARKRAPLHEDNDAMTKTTEANTRMQRPLQEVDPAIAGLLRDEAEREATGLELIPSENLVSEAVLEAMGSVFTNKYAEGYPG